MNDGTPLSRVAYASKYHPVMEVDVIELELFAICEDSMDRNASKLFNVIEGVGSICFSDYLSYDVGMFLGMAG